MGGSDFKTFISEKVPILHKSEYPKNSVKLQLVRVRILFDIRVRFRLKNPAKPVLDKKAESWSSSVVISFFRTRVSFCFSWSILLLFKCFEI